MQVDTGTWDGTGLPFDTLHAIVTDVLALGDVRLFPQIFAVTADSGGFWRAEQGQLVLTEMLALLLDQFNLGDAQAALAAMADCPREVAQQAHELLLRALGGNDGPADPVDLDDAAVLCAALLLGAAGQGSSISDLIREAGVGRTSL